MTNVLHFTVVDSVDGWPTCEEVAYEGRQPGPYQEHVILQKGGHLAFIYVNLMGAAMRSAVQGIGARVGHSVPMKGGEELIKRWSRTLMARMTRGF